MSTLSPPVLHRLDLACHHIAETFKDMGHGPYLVGSVQERSAGPQSDVDIRLILVDEHYDALMAGTPPGFATLLDFALGAYVRELTGLPIDFQVQRMTEANAKHGRPKVRHMHDEPVIGCRCAEYSSNVAHRSRNPLGGRSLTNWLGDARPEPTP